MTGNQKSLLAFCIGAIFLSLVVLGKINLVPTISTPTYVSGTPSVTLSPTATITLTPSPTLVNTEFRAVTKTECGCYTGTSVLYQELKKILPYEIVMVLRRNITNDWFLTRWDGADCWMQSDLLQYDFDIIELAITSTPPPPTLVPTSTRVVISITPPRTKRPPGATNPSGKTAQALTQQAAQALTQQAAQALTQQAAQALTQQAAQALTQQAAYNLTAQALTAQACVLLTPNLSGSNNGLKVHLSWSPVLGATSYEVFVSIRGAAFTSLGTTEQKFMDDSIANKTTNIYYVIARNSCGESKKSNTVTISR